MGLAGMSRLRWLWSKLHPRGAQVLRPADDTDGLDVAFYREWYPDLRGKGDAQLREHWRACGRDEGRWPSLDALLRHMALDADDLQDGFDWRVYLALYDDLTRAGLATRAQAIVHFLEYGRGERRSGAFNEDFYTAFHPDLAIFAGDREAAIGHWLEFGNGEGRSPTLRHHVAKRGLPAGAVPDEIERGEVTTRADGRGADWPLLVRALLQEPPGMPALWGDPQRDEGFYLSLAAWHERAGNDRRASEIHNGLIGSHPAIAHAGLGNIAVRAAWASGPQREKARKQMLALAHYREALRYDGEALSPKLGIARALADTLRHEEALVAAENALRAHPDSSEAESLVTDLAAEYWSAGWSDADCLAAQGAREALFAAASKLARRVFDASECVVLRGAAEPVRPRLVRDRVLIIGDCQLPQCLRYRIDQKLEQLAAAGYDAKAVSWTDADAALQALAFYDQVIFYRVPALPQVVRLIAIARTLGKVTFYEIDDLLFDPMYPPPIATYGGFVGPTEYLGLVKGAALFHAAAQLCEYGIASTLPLVARLGNVVRSGRCFLHRNGLDRLSPTGMAPDGDRDPAIKLFYGSGTRAHNSDFIDEALPALLQVLADEPRARLTIAGYLSLPDDVVARLAGQLVELPMTQDLDLYWRVLAASDINLAVLKPDAMTDCKSELKWLEAGVMGIPSVVSPTRNYLDVVRDGEDALLASGPAGWHSALSRLVRDPDLRLRIGEAARARALNEYAVVPMAANLRMILDETAEAIEAHASSPRTEMMST